MTDLEWKIIYVGSAESEEYDQTLDTVVVGPLCAGRHMFVFEVNLICVFLLFFNKSIHWPEYCLKMYACQNVLNRIAWT